MDDANANLLFGQFSRKLHENNGVFTLDDAETDNETYEMFKPMASVKLSRCSVNTFTKNIFEPWRGGGRPDTTPRSDNVEMLFCITVALVETNSRPMGVTLVNTQMSHKLGDPGDLVELAKTVQKVKEGKCSGKIRGCFLTKGKRRQM